MSGLKDLAKGGWHPKGKEGGKESWRGDFKGLNQVAGWMGKGKDPHAQQAREHQSTPLSALKDPATFAPPPKHVGYHGASASPSSSSPASGGLGSAVPVRPAREEEEASKPKPPPVPYRVDTTGLSTANLPRPPPARRAENGPPTPASPGGATRPALPPRPRLPPRQNSHPDTYTPDPPPSYNESVQHAPEGALPQGALSRLGQAGVSVPGFNIGRTSSPPVPARAVPSPTAGNSGTGAGRGGQMSELQSRFSKMSVPSSKAAQPSSGTTWEQKQAALKTASALRNDPSSVSLADARSAASTANNFRERHGEQVGAGFRTASSLNQKYGVLNKVNTGFGSASSSAPSPPSGGQANSPTVTATAAAGKKPPPPPPPKKKELVSSPDSGTPPPIPFGSKPRK